MATEVNAVAVSQSALAPKKSTGIQQLIQDSVEQLKMALPSHMRPERIVRIALTTLRVNPALYECDPHSFLAAIFQSAQLGLEPNINGESWLIPYHTKKGKVVQFQIGAYGLVKLFWNHNNSVSLQVEKVYEKDDFVYDLGACTVAHKPPAFNKERGAVIGYYAYATLANGGHQLKVMSKTEAKDFAIKHSKCYSKQDKDFIPGTPWKEHFDAMAMKTILKQLMKLLPKSVEIQNALAMDETVKTKLDIDMVAIPNEVEYAELGEEVEEGKVEQKAIPTTVEKPTTTKKAAAKEKEKEERPMPDAFKDVEPAPRVDAPQTASEALFGDDGAPTQSAEFQAIEKQLTNLVNAGAYKEDIKEWGFDEKNKARRTKLPPDEQKMIVNALNAAYKAAKSKPVEE